MRTRKLVVATAWMAALGACCEAQEQITVVIFDYTGVPVGVLKAAAETAREAFREVGVDTRWSVCHVSESPNEECLLPPAGSYLQAKIVPDCVGRHEQGEAVGLAVSPKGEHGVVSYAFYKPMKASAERTGQPISVVLGYVMAHEIGHLLGLKHTLLGIMKPTYQRRDLLDAATGSLHFDSSEGRTLRAAARH